MISQLEARAATVLGGSQNLRVPKSKLSAWVTCRLGFLSGIDACAVLLLILHIGLFPEYAASDYFYAVFPMYRMIFLIVWHMWLWGIVIFLCRKHRINYPFILQADQSSSLK